MTKLMKRVYLAYLTMYTVIISVFFIIMPEVLLSTNNTNINFGIGYLLIFVLTILLIVLEKKLKVLKHYWIILYSIIGFILPAILLYWDKLYIVVLAVVVPLLILNIILKKNTKFDFNVQTVKLLNVIFNTLNILSVLIIMTNQLYWYLCFPLIIVVLIINVLVYLSLKHLNQSEIVDIFISYAAIFLIYINAVNAELRLDYFANFNFFADLVIPLIILALVVVTGLLNSKQIDKLIKCSSTE